MAREHELFAILPQTGDSVKGMRMGYTFPQNVRLFSPLVTPPPKTIFNWLPRRLAMGLRYRWLRRSLQGPAQAVLLDNYHLIQQVLRQQHIDVVVIDHIYSLPLAACIRRLSPESTVVFHAHNVDSDLLTQLIRSASSDARRRDLDNERRMCLRLESSLARYADTFWACSDLDKRKLEEMNVGAVEGYAIPNGVDTTLLSMDSGEGKRLRKKLIFCGHMKFAPNVNGLKWFANEVWPLVLQREPSVRMMVIGLGGIPSELTKWQEDDRVEFRGEVESVIPHYHEASVAVVPLLEGSGVREKILEAMSLGNPVVSTTKGAEGMNYEAGRHLVIADRPVDFADAVCRLLKEAPFFENTRQAARRWVVEKYEWTSIGHEINRLVDCLARRGACSCGRSGT
jgi:glycosyltransferase involved in cell wall biosynthesis